MLHDFIVHVSSHFRQSTLHCLCFISFPSVHTSLIIFHFYFSFISLTTFCLVHIYLIWVYSYYMVIVSFTFQPIPSLEINNLQVSLDKFLILNRYALLEAELCWFYYSLSFYIKQEIQQRHKLSLQKRTGFYSDTVTRSPIFQPAIVFVDIIYSQPRTMRISKFTFACTCLSFCSLPITPFVALCLQ